MESPTSNATSAEVTGTFPPSPIQEWFLTQEVQGANHWNQTFLFTVDERLDTAALAAALRAIIGHHGALRQRFIRRNNTWEASIHPVPDDDILTLHDLSACENSRLGKQIERACKVEQARLSFEFGPLLRAAYMDCGEDRPGRLLVTVHQLAVDALSWRILMEDIEKAYRQAAAGERIVLPPATAPFSAWTREVRRRAGTSSSGTDAAFWRDHLVRCTAAGTLRHDDEYGSNTESDSCLVCTRLSAAETGTLLQRIHAAWCARINDALLAVLVRSLHEVQPFPDGLTLHVAAHGREPHIGGDMDVSRTVGWFTTLFPVCLTPVDGDAVSQVRSVQQHLSEIPGNGSGFAAPGLKHEAAILFNYSGRVDDITDGSELFSFAPEPVGPSRCQNAGRKYQIEITVRITGSELEIEWKGGRYLHGEERIQALAGGFHAALLAIVNEQGADATAPDTPLTRFDSDSIGGRRNGQAGTGEMSVLRPAGQLL